MSENPSLSFEKATQRLEEILEKMNTATTSLEDSVRLFEEAESLVRQCEKKLELAEQKIEQLVKKRSGELDVNEEQKPLTQPFPSPRAPVEELPF